MAEVKKPRAQITISRIIDIESVTRYYKLQSASAAAPSKPTDGAAIPSGWTKTEPAYQNGATNRLYFVDQTIMTNGDTHYSQVSLSSSYEAAKEAWDKANNAQNAANDANNKVDNLQVGGRNLIPDTTSMKTWVNGWKLNITYDQEDDRSGKDAVKVVNTQGTVGEAWFNRLMSSGVTCPIGTYTISFYAKSDSDTESTIQAVAVIKPGSSDRSVSKTFYVNKTWKRYTFTYDIVESYTTTSDVYWFNFLGTSAIYFAHFKLERGNIATDWTPAPEDVDKKLEAKVNVDSVISAINASAETVAIEGKKVNLKGAVTFESFDSATQTKVNTAKSTADTAKATADNASKTAKAISDNIYTANTTTIDGAKITTGSIKAEQIDVNTIFAEDVEATGTIKGVNIKGASGEFTKDFSVNTLVSESNDKDQNIYFKIYNNKDGIFIGLKSETQANSYISLEALSAALVGLNVTIGGARSVKISAQTGMMLNCPNGVSVNDLSVTKNVHVAGNLYRNGNLIGETVYGNSTTAKAIKSGAWSNTNSSVTLPPGVYMMTGTILFAASKGGRLGARFATSDNGFDQTTNVIPGTATAATGYVQCQWIMSVTEETKYYLQAWQSSGANVNVTASYMKAVRIV